MGRMRREQRGAGRSDYGPPRGERELAAFAEIASACFNVSIEDTRAWFERGDTRNLRLLREGEAVAAGLLLLPMGQWFGGRSISMTGIAGVGVPADRRGQGWALRLMRAALAELRASGVALSADCARRARAARTRCAAPRRPTSRPSPRSPPPSRAAARGSSIEAPTSGAGSGSRAGASCVTS
jgi:hypothetical protein